METKRSNIRIRPAQVIPLSFLGAILLGTALLMLPFSTAPGVNTDLLTALFTATTSVCVTGLVVVDTFSHWSLFGKVVILLLIQAGGLGIIAVTSLFVLILGRRMSASQTLMIHDAFNLDSFRGVIDFLRQVALGTFAVELLGAVSFMPSFIPRYGPAEGIWYSLFHSVSAFCNAGIDIMGPDSLASFTSSPAVLVPTMILIILGGLGFVVWFDVTRGFSEKRSKKGAWRSLVSLLSVHSRLVLFLTASLIAAGTLLICLFEWSNPDTLGGMDTGDKLLNALFQSVTFRTAGFATFSQKGLTKAAGMTGMVLMFIGGSPVGTAGGVKTVTMAIILANVMAYVRGRHDTVMLKRRVETEMVRKATAIVTISVMASVLLMVLLFATSDMDFLDLSYEAVSALGTVGLSRNVTPRLNTAGRIFIIIGMYVGRIGPISMALFLDPGTESSSGARRAAGRFYVG